MKISYLTKLFSLFIIVHLLLAPKANAQNEAFVQVIHNSADPAAAEVDIYVNGDLTLDDFEFRQATEFLALPSGVEINIGVAPGTSTSNEDIIATFTYTLEAGQSYILVASGVLGEDFSSNPDEIKTAFDLKVIANVRREVSTSGNVEFQVVHGATDAPTVDVFARGVESALVAGAPYFANSDYISVSAASYELDIRVAGTNTIAYSVDADLSGLSNQVVTVLASGFLYPKVNSNGKLFALIAVLSNGTVVELPSKTASIQVIHNASDPVAATVDIFINGDLTIDDFEFRTATKFLSVPAYLPLVIDIAGSKATDVSESIATFEFGLPENSRYSIFANGVITDEFVANPDEKDITFDLIAVENELTEASTAEKVALKVLHGATDAPTVDISARGVATLVEGAAYGDATEFFEVPAAAYTLDILVAGTQTIAASFDADLSTLGGGVAIVAASGFYTVSKNNYGELFGLVAVLADGTLLELPSKIANAQVIHNAADPGAKVVDIYVNGDLAIDDFEFRSATPYIKFPAYLPIEVGVAAANSSSVEDALAFFSAQFTEDVNYNLIANGVLNPTSFATNPEENNIAFNLFLVSDLGLTAQDENKVDLHIFHGATDAPFVDVAVDGTDLFLAKGLGYGAVAGPASVVPNVYTLNINVAGTETTAASFLVDLSDFGGASATVLASGFLTPDANENGEGFALLAVLADGTTVTFNAIGTSVEENALQSEFPTNFVLYGNFPNPFNPSTNIQFDLPVRSDVSVNIFNILGQNVMTINRAGMTAGVAQQIQLDASTLSSGVYLYQVQAIGDGQQFTAYGRMTLVK